MAQNRNLAVQWDGLFPLSCFTGQFMVTTEKPTETHSLNCVPLLEPVYIHESGPYLYYNSVSRMVTETEKTLFGEIQHDFPSQICWNCRMMKMMHRICLSITKLVCDRWSSCTSPSKGRTGCELVCRAQTPEPKWSMLWEGHQEPPKASGSSRGKITNFCKGFLSCSLAEFITFQLIYQLQRQKSSFFLNFLILKILLLFFFSYVTWQFLCLQVIKICIYTSVLNMRKNTGRMNM